MSDKDQIVGYLEENGPHKDRSEREIEKGGLEIVYRFLSAEEDEPHSGVVKAVKDMARNQEVEYDGSNFELGPGTLAIERDNSIVKKNRLKCSVFLEDKDSPSESAVYHHYIAEFEDSYPLSDYNLSVSSQKRNEEERLKALIRNKKIDIEADTDQDYSELKKDLKSELGLKEFDFITVYRELDRKALLKSDLETFMQTIAEIGESEVTEASDTFYEIKTNPDKIKRAIEEYESNQGLDIVESPRGKAINQKSMD